MTAKIKFAKFCAISVILPAVVCDRVLESTLYRACVHIIDHFRPTQRMLLSIYWWCLWSGWSVFLDNGSVFDQVIKCLAVSRAWRARMLELLPSWPRSSLGSPQLDDILGVWSMDAGDYGGRIKLIWIHTPCILFTFSQGKNEDSFTAYRFCTHCLLCILLLKVNYNLPYSLVFTCHSSSFSAVITLHSVHSSQHQNGVQLTRRTFRFVCCWPDGHCSAFIRALVVRISQFLLGRPLPGVCCGE